MPRGLGLAQTEQEASVSELFLAPTRQRSLRDSSGVPEAFLLRQRKVPSHADALLLLHGLVPRTGHLDHLLHLAVVPSCPAPLRARSARPRGFHVMDNR